MRASPDGGPGFGGILAAVDLSAIAVDAFHQAEEIALMTGGGVEAVHVSARPALGGPSRRGREALRQLRQRLGPRARLHILQGEPAEVILRLARDLAPRLVVMGTSGRRGLARVILGSTAEAVVRRSPAPVVTVRSEPRHVRSILAPVAFTHYGISGIPRVAELANDLNASVRFLHVAGGPDSGADPERALAGIVRRLPKESRQRCAVDVQYSEEDPTAVILANSGPHDLIAVGFHRRGALRDWALGTTAERLMERSRVPVMTLPYLAADSAARKDLMRRAFPG